MKKFVNDPAQFVPEFMHGIALANPDLLEFTPEFQMITRKGGPDNAKVSGVQGSGSGHEPAHVMAVGPGMLTGACQGAVFAAPAVDSCYETIKACNSDAGVLVLVNNYQGDRMAWDMATEMATAEGINARQFWINDDVAVEDSLYTVGRRGVVIDPELAGVDPFGGGHLRCHVPGHAVALVVVDQHQHAGVGRAGLDRLVAGIDRRGGEHRALAGAGQHAGADRHDVRRLVARARALHDRDLRVVDPALAGDHLELGGELEQIRVGQGDALHELGDELRGIVDELLHELGPLRKTFIMR